MSIRKSRRTQPLQPGQLCRFAAPLAAARAIEVPGDSAENTIGGLAGRSYQLLDTLSVLDFHPFRRLPFNLGSKVVDLLFSRSQCPQLLRSYGTTLHLTSADLETSTAPQLRPKKSKASPEPSSARRWRPCHPTIGSARISEGIDRVAKADEGQARRKAMFREDRLGNSAEFHIE